MKSAGLSRQKVSFLKKILLKILEIDLLALENLKKMNDENAISCITKLKGLGVWSAEMFLIFKF
ncbi:MAG: hypothetical protein Ct9H300mP5_1560 [Candidatus Pelagibacterales bacterium]|nr:MAG: hypothetical protein Ct9H300mP5_1560 [Pelagibacterales bacterium]